ncbi:endoglucanase [Kineosporia sp. NBRC 101677]|uniref:glycoside hydrolase family 5 protein n=1 Tax=Kineosporia sp. NBRC 101677 TaxID=3032197 RepID=UPI0024A1331B|nr:cellulase family glycosylhydrolase [Kineosporia sp. NBRC 101677]GLY19158.1 endoglucanase [Kineosporia sp. NBRC 101677]
MHAWGQVRGVNLGGLLDLRQGVRPGWELRPEHLDAIAAAGFDCVRLPVRWWDEPLGSLDEVVRSITEQALARNLAVVLSMHHADGLMQGEPGAAQKLVGLWAHLARGFADQPDARLAFDLLNEPRDALTPSGWNSLLPKVLEAVRTEDGSRPVIVSGARAGALAGLLELDVPRDEHLVATLHYYEPFAFTHQSAHWEEGADAWAGTRWLGGESNARGNGWPGGPHWADAERDRRAVTNDLSRAAAWAADRGLPVVIGEFGAYEKAPWADRMAWTGWVRSECERLGLGWVHWDFATDFGVFDPAAQIWRADLLKALRGA